MLPESEYRPAFRNRLEQVEGHLQDYGSRCSNNETKTCLLPKEPAKIWRTSLPTRHDLDGLMKFLNRDVWAECFDLVFDTHFGPILEAGNIEFEDLAEIVGDDWANTLWGCAFEDFLTQEFEVKGVNIVDDYLKRRGWKESAQAKAYMKALRNSVMSLYEISEIVPGKSLLARDLIRGGDPVLVSENTATLSLKQWDKIAARIMPVMGKNVLGGGLLTFSPPAADTLFDGLRQTFGSPKTKKLPRISDDDLQMSASIFTMSWLVSLLDRAMKMPELQNSDGDQIVFHDVRFPLAAGAKTKAVIEKVNAIPGMVQADEEKWNWLEPEPKNNVKEKDAAFIDTRLDDGARVLGTLELEGRTLIFATNSAERAQHGTALVQQALGGLVRTPLTEIRTVEQLIEEADGFDEPVDEFDESTDFAEQTIHEFMDRQYRDTLDQPVGMLGNKTPRQAVKSSAGRKKVAEWLKYLENQTSNRTVPGDPMASYSFEWMWRELGVLELRK